MDPRCSTTDIPLPQSAALGLHPVARRLLLINRPRRDGTLSWRWYTAATGGSRTHYLAITSTAPYHSATAYHSDACTRICYMLEHSLTNHESNALADPQTLSYSEADDSLSLYERTHSSYSNSCKKNFTINLR